MGWTGYPELNRVLGTLVQGSLRLLGDNLIGVYLHGSLAAGEFNSLTSDVDFVVVTNEPLAAEQHADLNVILDELKHADECWTERLEGSFVPAGGFVRGDDGAAYPTFDEGQFVLDHTGIYNALQRHTLREHGIALVGPAPSIFVSPVSSEDLMEESLRILDSWWKPQLIDTHRLHDRAYQAYAVLTLCRILYTLHKGEVASKPAAARWAIDNIDRKWRPLIERAVNWRKDDDVDDIAATLDFISFVDYVTWR